MTVDTTARPEPHIRALDAEEIEAVSGGIAPFFAGYLVGVAATAVGIGLVHAVGSLWDWLFD